MASLKTDALSTLAAVTSPSDTDLLPVGTGGGNTLKKLTWANLVASIKTALGIGTIDTAITDKYALAKISTVTVEAGTVAANGFSGNIATTFTKISDDAKCIPVLINGGWLTCTKCTINGNTLSTEFANWSNGSHSGGGTFYILQFVKMK